MALGLQFGYLGTFMLSPSSCGGITSPRRFALKFFMVVSLNMMSSSRLSAPTK